MKTRISKKMLALLLVMIMSAASLVPIFTIAIPQMETFGLTQGLLADDSEEIISLEEGIAALGAEEGIAALSANGQGVRQIAIGHANASYLAIRDDGTLWSWGGNWAGQLGLGDTASRHIPTQVGTATDWHYIATAQGGIDGGGANVWRPFVIAIRNYTPGQGGELWAWGSQLSGRLGNGVTANTHLASPVRIGGYSDWTHVATGTSFAFGIRSNGWLYSWGQSVEGQLGGGSASGARNVPTRITGGTGGGTATWAHVSANWAHGVAIRTDGTIWSWGNNTQGRTGLNTASGSTNNPAQITGAGAGTRGWRTASAGGEYTVAIANDGSIWAWGAGIAGNIPVRIGSDYNWQSVSAGVTVFAGDAPMGLRTDGTMWNLAGGITPSHAGNDWVLLNVGTSGPRAATRTDGTLWMWGNDAGPGGGPHGQWAKGIPGNLGSQGGVGATPWRVAASLIPNGNDWIPPANATTPAHGATGVTANEVVLNFDRPMRTDAASM
ncbi:MAG: hypothetical protein FWC99_07120, partial [Coriobacteriia bacterium]|nr:hypothetical protein [Coriobacteriia bacterium]